MRFNWDSLGHVAMAAAAGLSVLVAQGLIPEPGRSWALVAVAVVAALYGTNTAPDGSQD